MEYVTKNFDWLIYKYHFSHTDKFQLVNKTHRNIQTLHITTFISITYWI